MGNKTKEPSAQDQDKERSKTDPKPEKSKKNKKRGKARVSELALDAVETKSSKKARVKKRDKDAQEEVMECCGELPLRRRKKVKLSKSRGAEDAKGIKDLENGAALKEKKVKSYPSEIGDAKMKKKKSKKNDSKDGVEESDKCAKRTKPKKKLKEVAEKTDLGEEEGKTNKLTRKMSKKDTVQNGISATEVSGLNGLKHQEKKRKKRKATQVEVSDTGNSRSECLTKTKKKKGKKDIELPVDADDEHVVPSIEDTTALVSANGEKDVVQGENDEHVDTAEDGENHEPYDGTLGDLPSGARAFRRVQAEDWIGKKGSWDNSYNATFGDQGWGAKAQETLGKVRGKDFKHEKTKKKRGSYRGGVIDSNAVNSIKFDD